MTLKRPLFMQAAGGDPTFQYSALDTRALIRGIFYTEGVIAPDVVFGALKVTQRGAGANFSVDVAAGAAVVFGDDTVGQGMYVIESTATENRTIPGPPGAGTRIHRVVAQVRDKLHAGAWTTYEWTIDVLEDTGLGTPPTPASALSLARVSVSAGQVSVTNANITDDRVSAALIGAKQPLVAADSDRPPNPYESERIWRLDHKCWEVWTGTAWALDDATPPAAILRQAAPQNVPRETDTAVLFDAEVLDTHGGHSTTVNPSRYTAPRSGLYQVSVTLPWASGTYSGKIEAALRRSDGVQFAGDAKYKHTGATTPSCTFTRLVQMTAGQYVEALGWHNALDGSSAAMATLATQPGYRSGPSMDILWLRS